MDEKNRKFKEFLELARVKEGFKRGHTISQSEMARLIGIPQGSLSQYENGTRLPNDANAIKLGDYFGPVIYEILEMPPRMPTDPLLYRIVHIWKTLPTDTQKYLVNRAEESVDEWDNHIANLAGDVKR